MRRLLLLSGLIYALLLLGLGTTSGAALALAIPLTIYLAAALLYGPEELRLTTSRALSIDRVSCGVAVVVRVSITNEGSRLEEVLVEDPVPRPLELVDGEARMLTPLPPGATTVLEYTVRGSRGDLDFQTVRVRASDSLGLFRREATLPAPGHLTILPETLRLRQVAIRPRQTRAYAGPVPARRGGSGVEFFGVREYQMGDPLRWINWRTSARHLPALHSGRAEPSALFTNEFEQERIADVGLILDARQRTDIRSKGDALFEHSVRVTASLAETFLSDGNRVGLLIYGGFLDWTFPGYGKVQRERILRALAGAETGESLVFESLDYIPTRYFPARSQLVLISPLCEEDPPPLVRLRARGYQLLVVSPDPIAFEAKMLEPQTAVSLATRIARLERTLLIRKLQRAGVQTVDWRVDQPFDLAVHASLSRQPHWFRAVGARLPAAGWE